MLLLPGWHLISRLHDLQESSSLVRGCYAIWLIWSVFAGPWRNSCSISLEFLALVRNIPWLRLLRADPTAQQHHKAPPGPLMRTRVRALGYESTVGIGSNGVVGGGAARSRLTLSGPVESRLGQFVL